MNQHRINPPARVDRNQPEIVNALRNVGASVQHLHTVGQGCPDLLCGFRSRVYILEVKMPGARLTKDEREWIDTWQGGEVFIVHSPEEALNVIGAVAYEITIKT